LKAGGGLARLHACAEGGPHCPEALPRNAAKSLGSGHRALPHGGARRPCRALRGLCDRQQLCLAFGEPPLGGGALAHTVIAYNSCRNRHCPKCGYFHVVFTLPGPIADIAYQNKTVIYDLFFKAAAETTLTIAADLKHLGARIGITAVLHTWGSALTHHPHLHMIVPGGGIALDGQRWVSGRPGFFLPVRVLSRLFRRLFLKMLAAAHKAGRLNFFGDHAARADTKAFTAFLAPLRRAEWVVYAKRPFGGPEAVLAYLARYTHRVAIANSRLVACGQNGVTFKWKDYRIEGPARYKSMTLPTHQFIRRFLMHVLPKGLHRIRHYGLFASADRAANIERARQLLAAPSPSKDPETLNATATDEQQILPRPCPCCGGRMIIIETLERRCEPKYRPTPTPVTIRIDTS
jgi:hypothetical protein